MAQWRLFNYTSRMPWTVPTYAPRSPYISVSLSLQQRLLISYRVVLRDKAYFEQGYMFLLS